MVSDNYEIYKGRKEPHTLTRLALGVPPFYPPIRTLTNANIIDSLINEIRDYGNNFVVMAWITPPFGKVIGYGIYTKKEASDLLEKSKNERWSSPDLGSVYNISNLEERLHSLKHNHTLQI